MNRSGQRRAARRSSIHAIEGKGPSRLARLWVRLGLRKEKPIVDFAEVRRQRFAVPLADDRILCMVLGRYRVFADAGDFDISPHLIMDGAWEEPVSNVIVDRLGPGMTAVDVGANIGYFTLLMAMRCGPEGHVVSFEPNPRAFALLKDTLALNGLSETVTLFDVPLADVDDRPVILAVDRHHPGGAQLTGIPRDGMIQHRLLTRRLDGIDAARGATLVKIDTEGLEEAIWQGMRGLLDSETLRYVVVEFTYRSYDDPRGFLSEAIDKGFSLHRILEGGGIVGTSVDEVMTGSWFQMLLFER